MKKSSDDLWRLIKSLTAPEKRYFKSQTTRHGTEQSNYVVLFYAIDKQKVYDEKWLKQQLKGTSIVKNLPTLKNQLKGMILDTLVQLGTKNDEASRLDHDIQKAWWLGQKGFEKEAIKDLEKAVKKALACGFYPLVLKGLQDIKFYSSSSGIQVNEIITKRQKNVLEMMEVEADYYFLIRKVLSFRFEKEVVRTEEDRKRLEKIMSHPFLQDFSKAITTGSQFFFATTYGVYHSILRDDDTAAKYYRQALDILRANPDFARQQASNYFNQLNSYVSKLSSKGFTPEFEEAYRELEETIRNPVFAKVPHLKAKVTVFGFNHLTQAYSFNKDFERGLQFVKDAKEKLQRFEKEVGPKVMITAYYRGMYISFLAGDYIEALDWIADIRNTAIDAAGIITTARLLEIMAHYELGNQTLVESMIQSTRRFLKKEDRYYEVEKKIIDGYAGLIRCLPGERNNHYNDYELTSLRANEKENGLFNFFAFDEWIIATHLS